MEFARRHGEAVAGKIVVFIAAHLDENGAPAWDREPRVVHVQGRSGYGMNAPHAGGIPLLESGVASLDGGEADKIYIFHKVFSDGKGYTGSNIMTGRSLRRAAGAVQMAAALVALGVVVAVAGRGAAGW